MLAVAMCGALLVIVAPSPALAAPPRYPHAKVVAPWGNDGGPGTQARPWKTIGHAAREARPGDVVLIRRGTYTNQLVNVAARGERGRPIVFRNFPGEHPTIRGTGGHAPDGSKVWGGIHVVEPAAHLVFRGLRILGTRDTVDTAGVQIWRAHHITVTNSVIRGFGGGGVNAASSEQLRIVRNIVQGNAHRRPEATSGISIYQPIDFDGSSRGYTNVIRGNRVLHNENTVADHQGAVSDGNCIILDSTRDTGYRGRTLIANNTCFANGGRGIHVYRADNALVVNNTLYKNRQSEKLTGGGGGELSTHEASNVTFRNNLVWATAGQPGTSVYYSSGIRFQHNRYVGRLGARRGKGDRVIANPRLRQPGTHARADFRPHPTSPLVDRGIWAGAPKRDRTDRVRRGRPDIGSLEHR